MLMLTTVLFQQQPYINRQLVGAVLENINKNIENRWIKFNLEIHACHKSVNHNGGVFCSVHVLHNVVYGIHVNKVASLKLPSNKHRIAGDDSVQFFTLLL